MEQPFLIHRIKLQRIVDYWTEDYKNDSYKVRDTSVDYLTGELVVFLERVKENDSRCD